MPTQLLEKIRSLTETWSERGLPSRQSIVAIGNELIKWKKDSDVQGLWKQPPLMATATLDDGIGQGLELIHLFSKVAGLQTAFIGLCRTPEDIITACHRYQPDILGLTVLQLDSEPAITHIKKNLPSKTKLIAGGPIFRFDPELAQRSGIDFVASDVGGFLVFLLDHFSI